MTIRRKTQAETVEELKIIMQNRKDRIKGLTELAKNSPQDRAWILKEIEEHEKWIADTEKVIRNFYRPAVA